ncbi:MAG: EAL domain-containing protein, partial [Nitriliruptoraceae bacterium]
WHVRDIVEHLHPSERKATIGAVVDHINRPSPAAPLRIKTRLLDASDAQQYLDITVADLRDDNDVAGVVLTMQETTERTDLIRQVRELARRDSLTGLANRDVFNERLEHALARASREGRRLAVLTCDLDDFKDVNDTLGHAAGDVVLQTLSSRIQAVLRSSDTLARFGGDEFAVLCEDIESTHDAGLFARAVLGTTDEAVVIDGHRMRLGMSIGVVVDSGDRNAVEILRDADIALYEAKGQGKRRWVLHRIAMTLRNRARLQLADDLAHALADGALDVAYQPIVDLQHGDRIVGVEALVRWDHPEQGQLSPDAFVAIAERSGMVTAIGTFLLDEGLQTLRRCLDRDPELVLRLAVNVSVRELREPLLINHVVTTLDRYAIDPDFLVLEVTESSMFDDTDLSLSVMRQLREQGVRFAVDDFGTGYSSLAYLKQLPVDIVKVDQSFIADLDEPVSVDLVRAIVEIGRTLRLDVCAEGVETAAQHDALVELGCAFGQGFHHSRPMSADELLGVLAAEPERFVQRERSS